MYNLDMGTTKSCKGPTLEQRVQAFRELVFAGIEKAKEQGKSLKPYDGAFSLQWPALVHTTSAKRYYSLRLSCSVLGGESSHFSWRGRSWRAVFEHATSDVAQWIEELDDQSSEHLITSSPESGEEDEASNGD